MSVGIIGAGLVGAACAKSMLLRGTCQKIVLNDIVPERARGLANDLSHGGVLYPATRIDSGSLDRMTDARVIVVTAGVNEREGGATDRNDPRGRLLLLPHNAPIYKDIIPQIGKLAPDTVILVVTDPPDALADVARLLLRDAKILSSGTFLDSLRFRLQIARKLGCDPGSVDAYVLGEHGTSQVYAWSSARIGGESVLGLAKKKGLDPVVLRKDIETSVKYANIEIIRGTGASQHGIGIATARIVEAILRDEGLVAPIGTYHESYGVTLSLPSVINACGVAEVLNPTLDEQELAALDTSARMLREALDGIANLLQ